MLSYDMYGNELTGTLCSELGALTKLTTGGHGWQTFVMSNDLHGTIPTQIGRLSIVSELGYVHEVDRGGKRREREARKGLIAAAPATLRNRLCCNDFVGTMPSQLGTLVYAQTAFLINEMSITGTIPTGG